MHDYLLILVGTVLVNNFESVKAFMTLFDVSLTTR